MMKINNFKIIALLTFNSMFNFSATSSEPKPVIYLNNALKLYIGKNLLTPSIYIFKLCVYELNEILQSERTIDQIRSDVREVNNDNIYGVLRVNPTRDQVKANIVNCLKAVILLGISNAFFKILYS